MNKSHLISILILGFIIVCFILYGLGIVTVGSEELIGYSIIIIGLALFYSGFQSSKKIQTFLGSLFFLAGVAIYIVNSFPITGREKLLIPSAGLITGLSLLMVYFQERKKIWVLILSVISITIGMGSVIIDSSINLTRFINSVKNIAMGYWPIVIIFILVTIILSRDKNGKNN